MSHSPLNTSNHFIVPLVTSLSEDHELFEHLFLRAVGCPSKGPGQPNRPHQRANPRLFKALQASFQGPVTRPVDGASGLTPESEKRLCNGLPSSAAVSFSVQTCTTGHCGPLGLMTLMGFDHCSETRNENDRYRQAANDYPYNLFHLTPSF
jgi:hypothetical protein